MPKIVWAEEKATCTLDSFLARYPPSKTYDLAGGDGWIWVRSNRTKDFEESGSSKSLEEAKKALNGLVERYKEIDVSGSHKKKLSNHIVIKILASCRRIPRYPKSRVKHRDRVKRCCEKAQQRTWKRF